MTIQITSTKVAQPGLGNDITTVTIPMVLAEMNVGTPREQLEPNSFALVKNAYPIRNSILATRPGLRELITLVDPAAIHWFKKVTDFGLTDNKNFWIIAAGNRIRAAINLSDFNTPGADSNVELSKLVNGKPRSSMTLATPLNSNREYAYVGTDEGMWKYSPEAGQWVKWGISQPRYPVIVTSQRPLEQKSLSDFTVNSPLSNPENGNVWYVRGAATNLVATTRISTTISKLIALPGQLTTGKYWLASLSSMGNEVQPATRVKIGPGSDYSVIEAVNFGSGVVSIDAVQASPDQSPTPDNLAVYTVVTNKQLSGVNGNSIIVLDPSGAAKLATLQSIIPSLDRGQYCYEIIIEDPAYVPTAGTTMQAIPSIKFYSSRIPAVGDLVECRAYSSAFVLGGGQNNATGSVQHNIPRDLSTLETQVIKPEDFLCFGVKIDDLSKLNEARVWLDIDNDTSNTYPPSPLTEFQRNYFFYAFDQGTLERYSTIESSIKQAQFNSPITRRANSTEERSLSVPNILNPIIASRDQVFKKGNGFNEKLTRRLFNKLLGLPENASSGAYNALSGKSQWFQFAIPISEMVRYGTDLTKDLKDCKGIQFSANVNANSVIELSSFWIGGGFTPDTTYIDGLVATEQGFFYTYRGRNSLTGDVGNAAPPTRTGLTLNRQEGLVRMFPHPDPQVDMLDVFRFSGVTGNWNYIGSTPNKMMNGGLPFIVDKFSDIAVAPNPLLAFDNFAPFAVESAPLRGTCKVVGNKVQWLDGDKFNQSLPRGTEIVVGGNTHLLYSQPTSDSQLETINFIGSYEQTEFTIPNPVLLDQGMPYVCGPYNLAQGFGGGLEGQVIFGYGDINTPGRVYWTNSNRIGSSDDSNWIDVGSGSEPIMSMNIYDGRPYVYTTKRVLVLVPKTLGNGELTFVAQQVANSKGTIANRCTASGDFQYQVNQEGVFASQGGQPSSISNGIRYLFPTGDSDKNSSGGEIVGLDKFPIPPPDFSKADYFSLDSHKDMVSFIYCDKDMNFYQLQFLLGNGSWIYNKYREIESGKGATSLAVNEDRNSRPMLYSVDEKICESDYSLAYDIESPVEVKIWTPIYTLSTPRLNKLFLDSRIRYKGTGLDIKLVMDSNSPTPLDNPANLISQQQVSSVGGEQVYRLFNTKGMTEDEPSFDVLATGMGFEFSHIPVNETDRLELAELMFSFVPKGERIELRNTDWEDCGSPLVKTLNGVMLKGNFPDAVTLEVRLDNGEFITVNVPASKSEWVQIQIPGKRKFRQLRLAQSESVFPVGFSIYEAKWLTEPAEEIVGELVTGKLDFGDCGWKTMPKFMLDFVERGERQVENSGELSELVDVTVTKFGIRGSVLATDTIRFKVTDRRHWFMGSPVKFLEAEIKISPVENGKKIGLGGGSCFHIASWNRPPETPMREVRPMGTPVNGGVDGTGNQGTTIL